MYRISIPAQSNNASWAFIGSITDMDDNPIDLTSLTLVLSIRDKREIPRLRASTDDGSITLLPLMGQFRWFFTMQQMRGLDVGTYPVGMTLQTADETQTIQLFVGLLPIISGNMG